jgi:glycerophosphoryl diester phosphodiesterase
VISHDADLAHLGAEGEISQRTLAELRKLDAGDGERVPTLDEVLDEFGSAVPFNLEIKRAKQGRYEGIEAAALAAVEARGLGDRILFSSFYDPVLAELRRLSPNTRIAVLVSRFSLGDPLQRADAVAAEAINPERHLMKPALLRRAAAAGLAVYSYTVDSEGEMEELLSMGATGLFTNHPDRMRSLVDRGWG